MWGEFLERDPDFNWFHTGQKARLGLCSQPHVAACKAGLNHRGPLCDLEHVLDGGYAMPASNVHMEIQSLLSVLGLLSLGVDLGLLT